MQSTPPSTRIGAGEIVDGKFRVERVLGLGGMGLVVAARQIGLERRVALKFVRASRCDAESLTRFMREARAVARLRSEHVARVLDVSTLKVAPATSSPADTPPAGTPYIVMEYLEGADLGAVLRQRGPLAVADATEYVLQACEAIAEAHALGIIHRDLKPENLFLTTHVDGRPLVKVLDFGISKLLDPGNARGDLALTRTADLVGSPNYMSPEQLRAARAVDARTDLWSLGVILYELLTGRLPFRSSSIMELCTLVLEREPPPITSLRPDLPAPLADAIMRCLRKEASARLPSVIDLAAALEPFAAGAERGVAERLRRISSMPASAPSAPSGAGGANVRLGSRATGTDVAWAETELDTTSRRRLPRLWIGLGLVALLLALGAAFAVPSMHRAPPAASATPDPLPFPLSAAASATPSAPPTALAAPPSAPSATVVATAPTPPLPMRARTSAPLIAPSASVGAPASIDPVDAAISDDELFNSRK